ncbi:hypothetical protein [Streptomyces sp. NPDC093589]|uniref:COG4315 family predicted lipoprotein n=1 Tax=Streptomyces sp. NPDC093589 TaxID=3366043 RepID=UPI0038110AAE
MRIGTRTAAALVVAGFCAVAVGGCSDSSSSGGTPSKSASASTAVAGAVAVSSGPLGKVLVDGKGRTLYLFEADKSGQSTCSGACAQAWPPLTVKGKAAAGSGVKSSLLGTTTRGDGTRIVTYNGHPLYTYQGDHAAGDVNGQGLNQFGAKWYVLDAAGNKITGKATSQPSKSSGGGGY